MCARRIPQVCVDGPPARLLLFPSAGLRGPPLQLAVTAPSAAKLSAPDARVNSALMSVLRCEIGVADRVVCCVYLSSVSP